MDWTRMFGCELSLGASAQESFALYVEMTSFKAGAQSSCPKPVFWVHSDSHRDTVAQHSTAHTKKIKNDSKEQSRAKQSTAACITIMSTSASTPSPPTNEECLALWNRLDYNGNGLLSLAEIDKGIVDSYPNLNHKPAIMRAYKACDKNDDGFITKKEFPFLLRYLHFYNELWKQFQDVDEDQDRRLDLAELEQLLPLVGMDNPTQVFEEMDANKGGYVLFDEFCAYMAKREE
jgi:Ca2+-binding EF-hand superfamily protein